MNIPKSPLTATARRVLRTIGLLALGWAALLASACGGGGSLQQGSASPGNVSVSLTDSIGDFVAYTVDVTSLQLVKQDGTQVAALPTTSRVDFTQYTDLSEFLTVASVPSGTYTKVVLDLDYSNADIEVQSDLGVVQKATAVDSNNQPVTTMSVTLDLPSDTPLVIAPGTPAALALDFDLGASNQVIAGSQPVVEVNPFLVADLSLDSSRDHRARGLLQNVDAAAQTFTMQLRPFAVRQGAWGLVTVAASATTHYEIDGVPYDGAQGLTQLANLSADTPLIVTGTVSGRQALDATEVLAGSSVPWSDKDVVQGTVIKRVGDTLTVRGHYINRLDGIAVYNSNIAVTVDINTKVTAPLSGQGNLDKDAISVGQAVTAFGTLSAAGGLYQLDSTGSDNRVRMDVTQLKGAVNNQSGDLLNTRLAFIEGRRVKMFDFTGTGATPTDDSLPALYDVNTAGLTLPSLNLNDVIKIRGFVVPFGQASTSDFSAISVIDLNQDALAAALTARWVGGTAAPFTGINSDAIVVDLSNATSDKLRLSGVDVALSTTAVSLKPANPNAGHYAVKLLGQPGITLYQKFADFSAALAAQLGGGAKLRLLIAHGRYSAADTSLTTAGTLVLLSR